ncbi:hypothetical protein GCT19_06745 [Paraburkholderia sp. CNPSo 3155]|uniref:hypothetical protein n=1 Tax=Paraburkholderia atlantica TaxID=2654982 RepID=UPI00132898F0|nr:hypothetical protein [Paraburkholderia atlantica]MPW05349.1 hypothetical protein [Paraburkholderia atlantica]
MTLERDAASLFRRMHLVIALTEVNSRHLRGESRRAGAETELACALASEERDGVSPARAACIEQLRERLGEAECELRAIESARDRLENELAQLDSRASSGTQGDWQ